MRDVRFKDLAAAGPHPGTWMHGHLEQFITRLSPLTYLLTVRRIIPSLEDVNRVLQTGLNDNGMSGGTQWKPFTITEEEYSELCEALITNPRFSLETR